jgi:hypothetical protein
MALDPSGHDRASTRAAIGLIVLSGDTAETLGSMGEMRDVLSRSREGCRWKAYDGISNMGWLLENEDHEIGESEPVLHVRATGGGTTVRTIMKGRSLELHVPMDKSIADEGESLADHAASVLETTITRMLAICARRSPGTDAGTTRLGEDDSEWRIALSVLALRNVFRSGTPRSSTEEVHYVTMHTPWTQAVLQNGQCFELALPREQRDRFESIAPSSLRIVHDTSFMTTDPTNGRAASLVNTTVRIDALGTWPHDDDDVAKLDDPMRTMRAVAMAVAAGAMTA